MRSRLSTKKISTELKQKYLDAQTNLQTAPINLENTKKNFYVYSEGLPFYDKMREEDGLTEIIACMEKLERKHEQHIDAYGKDNHLRLTGLHETSSMDKFTWGIGTRNTSVRIPNLTQKDGAGYFEDRRPAANIDPYLATSIIAETCCL